jgi:hypothetical protein
MKKMFAFGVVLLFVYSFQVAVLAADRPLTAPPSKTSQGYSVTETAPPAKQPASMSVNPAALCMYNAKPMELTVEKSSRVDNKTYFATIKAALDYAQSHGACGVNLAIDNGEYPEPLTITRNTSLMAKKTAVNHKSPLISGSIHNLAGHKLFLENISVMNAQDIGLEQNGGELQLSNVLVAHTKARPDLIATGMGVRLTGGVRAGISSLKLWDNASTALYVSGAGTKVKIFDLTVWENRAHPLAVNLVVQKSGGVMSQGLAAVDVSDGALLLVEDYSIKNCEFIGLVARQNGRVHLKSGWVEGTKSVGKSGSVRYGGTNLQASELGRIELKNFSTRRAEACGLMAWGGYMKAATGEVKGNAIGFSGHKPPSPTYDVLKCVTGKDIRYYENSNNLDTDYLPMPCAPGDASCGGAATCPGVAWE